MSQFNRLNEDYYTEMSDVVGRYVKSDSIDFSFLYSADIADHPIYVMPVFNTEWIRRDKLGTLELCGDWRYIPGTDDKHVSKQHIKAMKEFFKKYIVLFCMVWDEQLPVNLIEDYLRQDIDLHGLIKNISFYNPDMDNITSISVLEDYCRKTNYVDFHGN